MCDVPEPDGKVLLVGWKPPKRKSERLKKTHPASMSISFLREAHKAFAKQPYDGKNRAERRDLLFWRDSHPCCVVDYKPLGTAEDAVNEIRRLNPRVVLLLGKKVQGKITSSSELGLPASRVIRLWFPNPRNERKNVHILRGSDALRQLLGPTLST